MKIFFCILQVFIWNIWCCTVSNFYYARDISLIYCSSGSFLFVCLSCWVATYMYSWINIYRGWTNNGKTRQYRNKTVCVGCTERTLVASFVIFCWWCVVPLSLQYRLCLITVCMKLPQNGRLVRFQRGQIVGAHLTGASVTKNGHFIRCFQSSSFQGVMTYTNHGNQN